MTGEPAIQSRAVAAGSADVPRHVAIIMDGNGRWAAARGLPRVAGHRAGAQAVRRAVEGSIRHGVDWLTLYAFSSENWRRPESEVSDLTGLLRHYLRHEVAELHAEGVRMRVIGERERFDEDLRHELARAERLTAGNGRLNLTVALSYGGRAELVSAARGIAQAVRDGALEPGGIDEAAIERFLFTALVLRRIWLRHPSAEFTKSLKRYAGSLSEFISKSVTVDRLKVTLALARSPMRRGRRQAGFL